MTPCALISTKLHANVGMTSPQSVLKTSSGLCQRS